MMQPMNQLLNQFPFENNDYTAILIEQLRHFAAKLELDEQITQRHISWLMRFFHFHPNSDLQSQRHYKASKFLSYLATELNFDHKIQCQCLAALKFLYEDFYQLNLNNLEYTRNAIRRGYVERFGIAHCQSVIDQLDQRSQLIARLLVLANLKICEVINLKLSDINLKKSEIKIKSTNKRQLTVNIPMALILDLRIQIMKVNQLAQQQQQTEKSRNKSLFSIEHTPENRYLFPSSYFQVEKSAVSAYSPVPKAIFKSNIRFAHKRYLKLSYYLHSSTIPTTNPLPTKLMTTKALAPKNICVPQQLKLLNSSLNNFKFEPNFTHNHVEAR